VSTETLGSKLGKLLAGLSGAEIASGLFSGALPIALASWEPLRSAALAWLGPGEQASWQMAVPFGSLLIVCNRMGDAKRTANELSLLFPDRDSPQRRGSVALLVLGCVLLFLAHLSVSPPAGMLGIVCICAGWTLRQFGPFVFRVLLPAFLFLLLVVPVPHHFMVLTSTVMSIVFSKVAAQLLTILGMTSHSNGPFLYAGSATAPLLIASSLSGCFVVPATVSVALGRLLVYRSDLGFSLRVLAEAAVIGGVANLALICLLAVLVHQTGDRSILGLRLEWLSVVVSVLALELLVRARANRRRGFELSR